MYSAATTRRSAVVSEGNSPVLPTANNPSRRRDTAYSTIGPINSGAIDPSSCIGVKAAAINPRYFFILSSSVAEFSKIKL